jgi:hypothetical protein
MEKRKKTGRIANVAQNAEDDYQNQTANAKNNGKGDMSNISQLVSPGRIQARRASTFQTFKRGS